MCMGVSVCVCVDIVVLLLFFCLGGGRTHLAMQKPACSLTVLVAAWK